MKKLFKFEFRKLLHSKSFYIIFGLGLLSIILFMILGRVMSDFVVGDSSEMYNATATMLVVLPNSGIASLLGTYLVLFACSDFSQHTIKNIYARGYSRTSVYFIKYLLSLAATLTVAIFYVLFGFVFTLVLGGHVASIASYMWANLALQFLVLVGMHGMFFGVAMICNKTGVGIIVNVVGIELIFTLLNFLMQIAKIEFNILDYYLEMILANLMNSQQLTTAALVRAIVMPIVYAVGFVTAGWFVNRRREV